MNIKELWIEKRLVDVLRFYGDAFEAPEGREIMDYRYFVDITKGVVLFKIVTQDEPK